MNDFDPGQADDDDHERLAGVEPSSEPIHGDHVPQIELDGSGRPADSDIDAMPVSGPSRLDDALLLIYADALADLEHARISAENRRSALVRDKGMGGTKEEARLRGLVADLKTLEKQVERDLRKAMRAHRLGPWVASAKGVGDKTAPRLLAAVGDPYIDSRTGTPRTVSQLWAYCGYHVLPGSHTDHWRCDDHCTTVGVAAKRRKGQKVNWNPEAKMRAFLVADKCIYHPGPFRDIYDKRRAHTAITHPEWSLGHSHNDALRITAKAVLKEMWRASRQLHEEGGMA